VEILLSGFAISNLMRAFSALEGFAPRISQ
jgi:hypothetical protein